MALPYPTISQGLPLSYLQLSNLIDDCCLGALNCTALNILRLILNRTVRLQREENSITYEEIQDGVFIEGVCVQRGLGIAPATIAKHVKTLIANKLISVRFSRSARNGFMYSVYSINEPGLRSFAMASLPIPRKMRDEPNPDLQTISRLKTPRKMQNIPTSKNEVTEGTIRTTFGSNKVKGELKFSGRSAHSKRISRTRVVAQDTAAATVAAVVAVHAKRKLERPAVGLFFNDKGALKQQAFAGYWNSKVRECYPGTAIAGFTVKEFCVFRNLTKSIMATVSPADVADYIVGNWSDLLKDFYVSSAKWKPSTVPDIQSVVRHWSTIRPLLIAYYSAEGVREREHAALAQKAVVSEARQTKAELEALKKKLEAEQGRIKELERERAEVYDLAQRRGVDVVAARKEKADRKTRLQELLESQADALSDDDIPAWK